MRNCQESCRKVNFKERLKIREALPDGEVSFVLKAIRKAIIVSKTLAGVTMQNVVKYT